MACSQLAHSRGDQFRLLFSCDKDAFCKVFSLRAHNSECHVDDVFQLASSGCSHPKECPTLWWASPMCDPFSTNGKQKGAAIQDGCAIVAFLEFWLAHPCRGGALIMEQVTGFLFKKHRDIAKQVVRMLKDAGFKVYMKVLDPSTFFQPQRRPRVFIVALKHDEIKKRFKWPTPNLTHAVHWANVVEPLLPGESCKTLPPKQGSGRARSLVKFAIKHALKRKVDPKRLVVDIGCTLKRKGKPTVEQFPCITRTRATHRDFWILGRGRKVKVKELERAMGLWRPTDYKALNIPEKKYCGMLGNSVHLLMCKLLIQEVLRAMDR